MSPQGVLPAIFRHNGEKWFLGLQEKPPQGDIIMTGDVNTRSLGDRKDNVGRSQKLSLGCSSQNLADCGIEACFFDSLMSELR